MEINKRPATNIRAKVLMVFFLILFLIIFGRIIFLQHVKEVKGYNLQEMAEERWTNKNILEGKRGTIFDREGSALAQEIPSYTMYAVLDKNHPKHIKDPREVAKILSPYINISAEKLEEVLSTPNRFQVEFGPSAKNMSHEKKNQIEAYELQGIFFREEPRRYYPNQEFASHVIGYTERDMVESRMGLELSLDDYLRAEDGVIEYKKDLRGLRLRNLEETLQPPNHGKDVYLTIDSNIQSALEQMMTKVDEEYDPEKIIAIVADPKTGQILAMSNRPSFNPNRYEEITNYTNYAISDRFEPGSTMKIFTLAAAIEEGVFNPNDVFQSGTYRVGPDVVSDHNQGLGWGKITYREGFERSSNVAFSILALEKLGKDRLFQYVERFGFTEPTSIDLPGEVNSMIANQYQLDVATTAFGQATAVTPIQQVQAAMAVANGGKMLKPYIIDRMVDSETGEVLLQNIPEVVGEPISEATAKKVIELMEGVVVSEAGTGRPYHIEGFDVVGKTGTAQIPNPRGGGYLRGKDQNIFSFIGMAPKDDPQVVVYVAVDRPKLKPVESGSAPVSQIFNAAMKHSLQYLSIGPMHSKQGQVNEIGNKLEDYTNRSVEDAVNSLKNKGVQPIVIGNGNVVDRQQPSSGSYVIDNEKVVLKTDSSDFIMPDLSGWSFRDVIKFTKALQLKPSIFGSGFVMTQSIAAGSVLYEGDYITIELKSEEIEEDESMEENTEEGSRVMIN